MDVGVGDTASAHVVLGDGSHAWVAGRVVHLRTDGGRLVYILAVRADLPGAHLSSIAGGPGLISVSSVASELPVSVAMVVMG